MKILLSWLNEYATGGFADPTDPDAVAALADTMNLLGLEVASMDTVGQVVEGVVTARVLRLEQHPDAAKVQRVYVDAGDGTERHVWCGAFNMAEGDIVPLATLGTTMPNGMAIERRGILGIDSEGMLCAQDELGLGTDHTGIMILPADAPLGVPYGEVLGITPDILFDLDITRNRPDCGGYVGVARDLAAQLGREFVPPTPPEPVRGDQRSVPVALVDGERCGRFASTAMSGVKVGPSAAWMQNRLTQAGMRPINNVVDVSNYVMLELNQPNHAYDLDTLGGGGFIVRTAAEGETMVTLDGTERVFADTDLLICDGDDVPIGIGGVMGGLDTEITDATTNVVLETAWFDPMTILRTAPRLGLRSESSARYERGCDPYIIDTAIARFAELLGETCPDLVVHDGTVNQTGPGLPPAERTTGVRVSQVNRILGTDLSASDIAAYLNPIGYTVAGDGDELTVALPSWRPDSAVEIDVIEEIGRHFGYTNVGKTVPTPVQTGGLSTRQQRRRVVRDVLLGLGITEAMPNPFLAPDALAKAELDAPTISIANPLRVEESVLRTSLRPGLLDAIAFNESHRQYGVSLFEIGHVYPPGTGELPDEYESLCVVMAGQEASAAMAVWSELSSALGVGARIDQSRPPAGLHATRSATLQAGKAPLGAIGEVAPAVLARFEVSERVAIIEINLDEILDRQPKPARWKPVSKFPSSDLDLAFVAPDTVPADKLAKAIRQGSGPLVVALDQFDVFRGPSLGDGVRSIAYRLRLQAPDRNLTDDDVANVKRSAIAAAAKVGAELRG